MAFRVNFQSFLFPLNFIHIVTEPCFSLKFAIEFESNDVYSIQYRYGDDRISDFHFVFMIGTHKSYQTLGIKRNPMSAR